MNIFIGAVIGFIGWSLMGYIFAWVLLNFYDGARFPFDEISEADQKNNSYLRIKYALGAGFLIGVFWFVAIHHNPLISN
jgi:hypothetical protein